MRERQFIYFKSEEPDEQATCWVDGILFHSRFEADYYRNLKSEKAEKKIKDFERQVKFELYVKGDFIANHYVDYLVKLPNNTKEIREVKGFASPEWDLKRKLTEVLYPKIPYKIVRERKF